MIFAFRGRGTADLKRELNRLREQVLKNITYPLELVLLHWRVQASAGLSAEVRADDCSVPHDVPTP